MSYPYVIWTQPGDRSGQVRLVATASGQYSPEHRVENDAMGNPVWLSDTWGSLWHAQLAHALLERLTGIPDSQEPGIEKSISLPHGRTEKPHG